MIHLLNTYFVPVYSTNEEVAQGGSAPVEEKVERQRIYLEYANKKLPFGDVHFYILAPDATALDGISVNGLTVDNMVAVLEKTVRKLGVKPGGPVIAPSPQSLPPSHPPGSLVFHLVARGSRAGSYREFPSENWILLSPDEGKSILPGGAVRAGLAWDLEKSVALKWLTRFYPQGIDVSSVERGRIDQYALKATILSVENGIACARLDGKLVMKRSFSPGYDDNNFVHAILLGFLNFDTQQRELRTLRLVTTKATYGAGSSEEDFSAALRSMSPADMRQYLGQR